MALPDIAREISRGRQFIITSHIRPDGDSIGSMLGAGGLVRALGKKATLLLQDTVPAKYAFLKGSEEILSPETMGELPFFDSAIILDAGEFNRIGVVAELIDKKTSIINIDHHISNDGFGNASWVDGESPATAEMLTQVFDALHIQPDQQTAMALYTGVMSDTGRFRFSNTTPRAFYAAARMVEYGADPETAAEKVFYNTSSQDILTLGKVLYRIQLEVDEKIAISFMTMNEDNVEADGFVDYLTSIRGVEVALLFQEIKDDFYKVSLRSNGDVDVSKIAAVFQGGGHRKASGCRFSGSLDQAKHRLIEECAKYL